MDFAITLINDHFEKPLMKLSEIFKLKLRSFYHQHRYRVDRFYINLPNRIKNIIRRHFKKSSPYLRTTSLEKLNILPLDSAWAEAIIAPFHDPQISPFLPFRFEASTAQGTKVTFFWCWTGLSWEKCQQHEDAACLSLKSDIDLNNYDKLIVCIKVPRDTSVRFEIKQNDDWVLHEDEYKGTGRRMEITLPLQNGTLDELKLYFKSHTPLYQMVNLSWVGLQNTTLTRNIRDNKLEHDHEWPGLIAPIDSWGEIQFERGLVFDEKDINRLRKKKSLPGWIDHFEFLESKAEEYLTRQPEKDLSDYLPISDTRFLRKHENCNEPYYFEALVLGFVGIMNDNKEMMLHAIRYLMCMIHTKNWTQSAESRLIGSTWDQRCFYEELTTTSVSLLADWFSFALTNRAKDLIRQSIWDKGLAIIERDMMKYEYLHHMNQGAVFCRSRILGGLYIGGAWPRLGEYVHRAFSDMAKCLNEYIEKDGGVHEGIGYFCQTLQATIPSIIAYARSRGEEPKKYIKKYFSKCTDFIATMSGSLPGTAMVDGDCRTNYFCGDAIAVLADIFPNSVYGKIIERCISTRSIFSVTGTLTNSGGIVGFVYGPNEIARSECIVPTFSILPKSGHLASFRKNVKHSSLVHISGSRANPSHSHLDKGSVILEVDQIPILIDRGMVDYYYSEENELRRSYMHNVLTPILEDGTYPDQKVPSTAIIPHGSGDNNKLTADIKLDDIWEDFMCNYSRFIRSENIKDLWIIDQGELKREGCVAFHLHSTNPFKIEGKKVIIKNNNITLQIEASWAKQIISRQESINLMNEPVYHLIIHSLKFKKFALKTNIRRIS